MNKFCCNVFQDYIFNAGNRGFAIIPFKSSAKLNDYVFFLQFRSDDIDDKKSKLIVNDIAIKYCPWCGVKLSEIAELNKSIISEIALKNHNLIKI